MCFNFFQADYFNRTVLEIEGDDISFVEVAHCLQELRGHLMLQKTEKYLDPIADMEKDKLISSGYDEDVLFASIDTFYGG